MIEKFSRLESTSRHNEGDGNWKRCKGILAVVVVFRLLLIACDFDFEIDL